MFRRERRAAAGGLPSGQTADGNLTSSAAPSLEGKAVPLRIVCGCVGEYNFPIIGNQFKKHQGVEYLLAALMDIRNDEGYEPR